MDITPFIVSMHLVAMEMKYLQPDRKRNSKIHNNFTE